MTSPTTQASRPALSRLRSPEVRWSGGFWGAQLDQVRDVTVPGMWASLSDPAVSPGWRNFLIAAGADSGEHEGPPFLDGDLYKWMEAAVSLLETGPDAELAAVVEQVAEVVVAIQREDGYVHTPTLIAARRDGGAPALADRFNFETYNLGHLITLGVRHHRVTGQPLLLDAARRAAGFLEGLAEHRADQLARSAICPSHYMAVVDLYRATGEQRYLRLAERLLQVREEFTEGGDDNQDRVQVREQQVVTGHAVRANYLYAGLADLVAETGDEELQRVLTRLWTDVVSTKLYITGGCGALYDGASPDGYPWQSEISRVHQAYGRPYQLPQTTAHNESCANIGMILWSERMLALTGEARYADVIEQITYNSLLSSLSLDGRRYTYTNPLRQVRGLPFPLRMPGDTAERPIVDPPPSDARLRTEYLSCFCCPPNIARTLTQQHERVMSSSATGLWLHLYASTTADVELPDGRALALQIETEQPWDELVTLTVTGVGAGGMPIHLRIPPWTRGATVSVNDVPVPVEIERGYLAMTQTLAVGDRIELRLPMPVRRRRAHRLAEEATNQVAVTRGPVVYCLESTDLPDGVRLEQVALDRDTDWVPRRREIEGREVVVLEGAGVVLPTVDSDELYPEVETGEPTPVALRLIPYFAWGNRGPSEMSVFLPVAW